MEAILKHAGMSASIEGVAEINDASMSWVWVLLFSLHTLGGITAVI